MLRTLAKLVALAALGWVCSAHALGLGEIEIKSRLNQPLSAVIPISSATPRELESLAIELAGNDDFERAGMERAEFLSSLKFEIKDNVIRVTSKDLAREPFVSFLLDVRWGGGRLLREYTVLLDPPTLAQSQKPVAEPSPSQRPGAVPRVEEPAPAPESYEEPLGVGWPSAEAAPAPSPPYVEPAPEPSPAPATRQSQWDTPAARGGETYGPIQPKETLWSIAYKLRPDSSLTMDQMQVAIFNANPRAFEDGRLTGLMKGSVITIPGVEEIRAIDPVSAKAQVAQANRNPAAARPSATWPSTPAVAPPRSEPAPAPPVEKPAPPPAAVAPAAQEPAPEPAPTPAQAPSAQSTESAPTVTTTPVDPSQMVDEPAPSKPAPADAEATDAIQTEPLPAPPAAAPQPVAEGPSLMDQALGLLDHPVFLPVAIGLVVLLILLVLGGELRDRYAKWSYDRAARKKISDAAKLNAAMNVIPPPPAPSFRAHEAADDAATMVRDRTQRAPEADQGMSATATQAMVAETQQQTMQHTLQQTHAQTHAQTLAQTHAHEAAAAQTAAGKVDFDVSGTYATETVQINLDAGDPVSEAEFHRAYGLYDEAALLLKQALQKDPARTDVRGKLAEIYFEANKSAEFVELAKQLKGQLPDAEWQKIALLGSQIAADNELFKGATGGGTVDLSFDDPVTAAAPAPARAAAPAPTAAPADDSGMLDFTLDDSKMPELATPAAAPAAPAADAGLEFDLGSLTLNTAEAPAAGKPAAAGGSGDFKMDDLNLGDFDLKSDAAAAPSAAPAPAPATVALELGSEVSLEETPAGSDESSTKLDLARAYMDMGDNDMAKSLLNEVQQQGSAQQKKEAQELLSRVAA